MNMQPRDIPVHMYENVTSLHACVRECHEAHLYDDQKSNLIIIQNIMLGMYIILYYYN